MTARCLPDWARLFLFALVIQIGFVLTKWSGCELLDHTPWWEMALVLPTAFGPALLLYLLGRSKSPKR